MAARGDRPPIQPQQYCIAIVAEIVRGPHRLLGANDLHDALAADELHQIPPVHADIGKRERGADTRRIDIQCRGSFNSISSSKNAPRMRCTRPSLPSAFQARRSRGSVKYR